MADEDNSIASNRLLDVLGLLGTGGLSKAIIAPSIASQLPRNTERIISTSRPVGSIQWSKASNAIANSDTQLSKEGLLLNLIRHQKPEQEGQPARSGGVFYLPSVRADEANELFNYDANPTWGGSQRIVGQSLFRNPFFSYGAPGGPGIFEAGKHFFGHQGMNDLDREAQVASSLANSTYNSSYRSATKNFLDKYAPGMEDIPENIMDRYGARLKPWLVESAVGNKARELGYDSIIPYGIDTEFLPQRKPIINEIFDLRENRYPTESGGYSMWPQYQQIIDQLKNKP